MKILVIGGTGHMGTFLVPQLIKHGHDVYVGTRGKTQPRVEQSFDGATFITVDSKNSESIKSLRSYGFDTIVDFPGTAYAIWQELKNDISHLVACGSLWMFGAPDTIPAIEKSYTEPIIPAHLTRFNEFQTMFRESKNTKAVLSTVMPPNIAGPGKIPLDQFGVRSIENHRAMARGETVYLPSGPEVLISPCDAEDIATLFALIIENREAAAGEMFNAGAKGAMTASKFIQTYARLYGTTIPIEKVPFEEYIEKINPDPGCWWHFYAHMCPDITKAKKLLGYNPKYTSEQALERAVNWMRSEGML